MPFVRCECGFSEYSIAAARSTCPRCRARLTVEDLTRISRTGWRERFAGVGSSVAVHVLILALLWVIVAPTLASRDITDVQLESSWDSEVASDALEFDAAAWDGATERSVAVTPSRPSTSPAMAALSMSVAAMTPTSSAIVNPNLRLPDNRALTPNIASGRDFTESFRPLRKSDPRAGGVVASTATGGALDGILGHLRHESESAAVQVVWLMDASLSLHIDRQEIATRLVPFYREMIKRPDKKERPFRSAVVSYGRSPAVLTPSTETVPRIVESIAKMNSDPSGLENVFTAVQFALERFGQWKGQTIIVIWTDESGDDLGLLEATIQQCRQKHAVVHVVGPQAVLGMERGLQQWTIPETGQSYLIPVKRGPDAALPERLRVPYWFDSLSPPWSEGGAYIGQGASWFGGPLREGLLSGVGPYALTRLALETGGSFTILRRPGESQAVSWEAMRAYLPDYQRLDEILADVRREPLRSAVVRAAAITWEADLQPPPRQFFGTPSPVYPYVATTLYQPPELFLANIKLTLPRLISAAERDLAVIESALTLMDPVALGAAYDEERLPRWKAWYDLNLGRLLAMSVRLAEYRETLRLLLDGAGVPQGTNFITLVDSGDYKSGSVAEQRAVWARERLEKVVREHRGTPWSQLASWELEHELGFVAQPRELPLPRIGPVRSITPSPAPQLPKL